MPQPFRGITAANDWTFGQGRNSYFTKEQAIAADIKTSLLFFLNDCWFSMTTGIDWWNLLASKGEVAKQNILLQARLAIIQREGVVRINSVEAVTDSAQRRLTIKFNVDTIYSRNLTGYAQLP